MADSTPIPASVVLPDCALVAAMASPIPMPSTPPKPRKPLSEQEKAIRLARLEYARRRKKEIQVTAKAAGIDVPQSIGKGESSISFLLSSSELDAYHALLRQGRSTLQDAHQWLKARGFPI